MDGLSPAAEEELETLSALVGRGGAATHVTSFIFAFSYVIFSC